VGAGALPVAEHRRRPPIPIVPVDERARTVALEAGASDAEAWLAAVSGGATPVRAIEIAADELEVVRTTLAPRADGSIMSVGEVALAVDAGRELAARAAAEGVHVLVATTRGDASDAAAAALTARLAAPGEHGPLGALRRLGDAPVAVLCGVALGAGERGLGCLCDGPAARAGAAVAAAIEPDLGARVRAVSPAVRAALAATPPGPGRPTARPPAPR
jgi:NaMN:DMB phosphoribosyltransferase